MAWLRFTKAIGVFIALLVQSFDSQAQNFHFDQKKSKIEFEVSHLGVLSVSGEFRLFSGSMIQAGQGWTIQGNITVRSISTGSAERDSTLMQAQYLDAKNFKSIAFSGKAVRQNKVVSVTGSLTIRGKTKSISFILDETKQNFVSKDLIINRSFFELDFGGMDSLVGNEIKVTMTLTK